MLEGHSRRLAKTLNSLSLRERIDSLFADWTNPGLDPPRHLQLEDKLLNCPRISVPKEGDQNRALFACTSDAPMRWHKTLVLPSGTRAHWRMAPPAYQFSKYADEETLGKNACFDVRAARAMAKMHNHGNTEARRGQEIREPGMQALNEQDKSNYQNFFLDSWLPVKKKSPTSCNLTSAFTE